MSTEALQEIREHWKRVRSERSLTDADYHRLTAPCGLACFECYLYLAQFDRAMAEAIAGFFQVTPEAVTCGGCRPREGRIPQNQMECRVYACIRQTGMHTCAECDDFPCRHLHPYSDQAAQKPHNAKVYNLCRIGKIGLQAWAREEAGDSLDTYFYGAWTL